MAHVIRAAVNNNNNDDKNHNDDNAFAIVAARCLCNWRLASLRMR